MAEGAPFDPRPVVLAGWHVRLEPVTTAHADALLAAGDHPALWAVTVQPPLTSRAAVAQYVGTALAAMADGREVVWAIRRRSDGRIVGATRFMDIDRRHRRLEIGGSWITPEAQGSVVNPEVKRLQLGHAFDQLGAVRVQFKTDARNAQSLRALEKLGAVREGVLRRHMILPDGFVRDSVYFGITDHDWPAVRAALDARIAAEGGGATDAPPGAASDATGDAGA
jgi:RimJ/RimL family protein N-acetyltransferase